MSILNKHIKYQTNAILGYFRILQLFRNGWHYKKTSFAV